MDAERRAISYAKEDAIFNGRLSTTDKFTPLATNMPYNRQAFAFRPNRSPFFPRILVQPPRFEMPMRPPPPFAYAHHGYQPLPPNMMRGRIAINEQHAGARTNHPPAKSPFAREVIQIHKFQPAIQNRKFYCGPDVPKMMWQIGCNCEHSMQN